MMQVKLIEHYLNKHPDTQFANRLRAGFVKKYEELCREEFNADALFYELLDFASKSRKGNLSGLPPKAPQ